MASAHLLVRMEVHPEGARSLREIKSYVQNYAFSFELCIVEEHIVLVDESSVKEKLNSATLSFVASRD